MSKSSIRVARVLIIAGSDSGGGAGIQADLNTVSALGAYGMTAITALTAQNSRGIFSVSKVRPQFVAQQIRACLDDLGCDAVKTGMLASAETARAVAREIRKRRIDRVVVDPVIVATSSCALLDRPGLAVLKKDLLPLATVVTPNLSEAEALTGIEISDTVQMHEGARIIADLGPQNVVVKGGHLKGPAIDLLFDGRNFTEFRADRIRGKDHHGTGCVFASAIAVGLAKGATVEKSVERAKSFTLAAISHGLRLGAGNGPVNPMAAAV